MKDNNHLQLSPSSKPFYERCKQQQKQLILPNCNLPLLRDAPTMHLLATPTKTLAAREQHQNYLANSDTSGNTNIQNKSNKITHFQIQASPQHRSATVEDIFGSRFVNKTKILDKLKRVSLIKEVSSTNQNNDLNLGNSNPSENGEDRRQFIKMILTPSLNTQYLRNSVTSTILPLSQIHWMAMIARDPAQLLYLSLFDMTSLSDITFQVSFIPKLFNQITEDLLKRVKQWIEDKAATVCLCSFYSALPPATQNSLISLHKSRNNQQTIGQQPQGMLSQQSSTFNIFFHKLLTPVDVKQLGAVPQYIFDIAFKFYSKIFETAKKIFPEDTEWLEYDTILSKRIYLEDINEENWVINLQELFNSGRSPVSPQRRHTDKGGWERYDRSNKNNALNRHSKLEDAVKQRIRRDLMIKSIKQESVEHKKPTQKNSKLLSISFISKSDSKPRERSIDLFNNEDYEKQQQQQQQQQYQLSPMAQKQPKSTLNKNLILPTIFIEQFNTKQIVSPWSGDTIQSPLAGFALPLGKRAQNLNKRSQSIHHC